MTKVLVDKEKYIRLLFKDQVEFHKKIMDRDDRNRYLYSRLDFIREVFRLSPNDLESLLIIIDMLGVQPTGESIDL